MATLNPIDEKIGRILYFPEKRGFNLENEKFTQPHSVPQRQDKISADLRQRAML